jgi:mRNA-degrading endonuclease RelE of RelBE toxin-antitoxin system
MMKIFQTINYLPEFNRDMKKLIKRYPSLQEDLKVFIEKQLYLYHKLHIDNKGIVQLSGLHINNFEIFKARKFACRSLKGKGALSGIRIIYAYYPDNDIIEFIEIYYKGDQKNENKNRILSHYEAD